MKKSRFCKFSETDNYSKIPALKSIMDLGGGSMNLLITYLKSIDDKRDSWKIRHTLVDIVLLIFFARLSGAEYWEDIEDFGKCYEYNLRSILTLENGIPSHDTMQRVFATLNPDVLVNMTKIWANILEESQLDEGNFSTFSKRLISIYVGMPVLNKTLSI